MESYLNQRLLELQSEREKGRAQMAQLEQQRTELRETMLRISGAIQVLEELLKQNSAVVLRPATQTVEAEP